MAPRPLMQLVVEENWTGTAAENLITQEFMAVVTKSYQGEDFPQ